MIDFARPDDCPHCTPEDISFTIHYDPAPVECDCFAGVEEVTVSILDVNGKERDRFNAPVSEVDGVTRFEFPHDPEIQHGETVSIAPPLSF